MMEPPPAASRISKASDVLADDLRSWILGEALPPDAPVPSESEIMRDWGFSRGTVREALRLLENDGLIVTRRGPKGGIRVRRPEVAQVSRSLALILSSNQTPLRDLFALRKLVEPAVAEAAARDATAEQRAWLKSIAEAGDGPSENWRMSIEFHVALGRVSNNGLFDILMTALHDSLEWQMSGENVGPLKVDEVTRAHASIADAVILGDADLASRRMYAHVGAFEAVLIKQKRLDEPIIPRSTWKRRANRT